MKPRVYTLKVFNKDYCLKFKLILLVQNKDLRIYIIITWWWYYFKLVPKNIYFLGKKTYNIKTYIITHN